MVMSQQGGVSDTSLYQNLPEWFKNFLHQENLLCSRLEFALHVQSSYDDKHNLVDSVFRDLTCKTMKHVSRISGKYFVQFWKAEKVISDENSDKRHIRLTTRNQPFLLTSLYTKDMYNHMDMDGHPYCSYWSEMQDLIITGDGDGGAIGRAFQNKRMELTPDISYYSDNEYPHRDIALSCNIKWALAIPMFDKFRHAVGVVELVSCTSSKQYDYDGFLLLSVFRDCEVTSLACCKAGLAEALDWGFGRKKLVDILEAYPRIKGLMELVAVSHGIIFCQTWMLCSYCNSLFHGSRVGHEIPGINDKRYILSEAESICILQKGEGIVGKAALSSNNLVYCEDVSKLSIVEYPFAHLARDYGLSACFAISLQSDHTTDRVYVLEFFLSPSYVEGKDLNATLVPILQAMMNNSQTFKFASGEKLGRYVSVQVVDAGFPDQFESLEIPRLDPIDNHMIEMDFVESRETLLIEERTDAHISQKLLFEADADLEENIAVAMNSLKSKIQFPKKKKSNKPRGVRIEISKGQLMDVSHLQRVPAAKKLNVSVTTLKRVCRQYGIPSWRPRSIHQFCSSNYVESASMEELQGSAPTVHNESLVAVKSCDVAIASAAEQHTIAQTFRDEPGYDNAKIVTKTHKVLGAPAPPLPPQKRIPAKEKYMKQFPNWIHEYIIYVTDVQRDGNCGFRALAKGMGKQENSWKDIRLLLVKDIEDYFTDYYLMMQNIETLMHKISFYEDYFAPEEHWLELPDMGHIIASALKIVLVTISNNYCHTYFPLRDVPKLNPLERRLVCIGHVDNNHYVEVTLRVDAPLPPVLTICGMDTHACWLQWRALYKSRVRGPVQETHKSSSCQYEPTICLDED